MKEYKSLPCSCVCCKKQLSSKAIHSHFIVSHTEAGKTRAAKNREKSYHRSAAENNRRYNQRVSEYLATPNHCRECGGMLSYHSRNSQFCGHSCRATNVNKTRTVKQYTHRVSVKRFKRVCNVAFCTICSTVIRNNNKQKYCTPCRVQHKSEAARASAIHRGLGGVRPSKRIQYNGVWLGSSYELTVAQSLDAHSVSWTKSPKFRYVDPTGKPRTYEPDFYLPEYRVYLDPKNDFLRNNITPSLGFSDIEKINIVQQTHNIRVVVLSKQQLCWEEIAKLVVLDSNKHGLICKNSG